MRKVKVLSELYIGYGNLIYTTDGDEVYVNFRKSTKPYVRSLYTTKDMLIKHKYPVADIKMRWVYVDQY